jgi:hypothetical protein
LCAVFLLPAPLLRGQVKDLDESSINSIPRSIFHKKAEGRRMVKLSTTKLFRRIGFIALLAILFSIPCQTSFSQMPSWENGKCDDGICVYTSKRGDSKIDEYLGVVSIKTTLSALCSVMDTFQDYPNWLHQCKEGRNLQKVSDRKGYAYILYSGGFWGIADRDQILMYELTQMGDGSVKIQMDHVPQCMPMNSRPECIEEKPGIIRIRKAKGHWLFTPPKSGFVHVEYQMHMEPGGDLKPWLVNYNLIDIPYNTLKKLREEVKKPQHTVDYNGPCAALDEKK